MMHIVEMTPSEPSVTHVLPGGTRVTAVTSLGDHVFVVRWKNIRKEVEVYDSGTGTGPALPLQRRIAVRALGPYSYGLAACASNKCLLYASDYHNDCVHRVELTGSNKVTWWSVGSGPVGLTVNSDKNVLVVIQGKRKLQQFTTHGSLLRTIRLERDIESPSQVIQLSSGQFVISHSGDTQHRVCLVDDKGAVVRSYPSFGSKMRMDKPAGLAVDEHGNILVADFRNDRLLVLDPTLTGARAMSVSVDGDLEEPYSLWYDKSRARLYVGVGGENRVIVVDHLKDFTANYVHRLPQWRSQECELGGAPLPCPLPLLSFPFPLSPFLTGIRWYNLRIFLKLKVLVGEFYSIWGLKIFMNQFYEQNFRISLNRLYKYTCLTSI